MLGRGVAAELQGDARRALFSAELRERVRAADLFVLNLECCISRRGTRWPAPGKPFFFRAPPEAADLLADLGVDCVTLANNHALDFGPEALLDTIEHLGAAGIRAVGAGRDLAAARGPAVLESQGFKLAVVAAADHPVDFAARADRPGCAYADLRAGTVPGWLLETLAAARASTDAVLFSPHWGPNLTRRPPEHVRAAAAALRTHTTLIAGHSAHVFHGVQDRILYDLGDFVNDYTSIRPSRNIVAGMLDKLRKETLGLGSEIAASLGPHSRRDAAGRATLWRLQRLRLHRIGRMMRARTMRPDVGLLFLVTLDRHGPRQLQAVPLKIDRCHTGLAVGTDADFVHRRFRKACADLGTIVERRDDLSVVDWR